MAVRNPVVIAFDFILDRSPSSIGARPINEPLLDKVASESVEFRNSA